MERAPHAMFRCTHKHTQHPSTEKAAPSSPPISSLKICNRAQTPSRLPPTPQYDHRAGGSLKPQTWIVSQSGGGRPKSRCQQRRLLQAEAEQVPCLPGSKACWWSLVVFSGPWLTDISLHLCLRVHLAISPCVPLSPSLPSYRNTG